jgi:hypothetical protein
MFKIMQNVKILKILLNEVVKDFQLNILITKMDEK